MTSQLHVLTVYPQGWVDSRASQGMVMKKNIPSFTVIIILFIILLY